MDADVTKQPTRQVVLAAKREAVEPEAVEPEAVEPEAVELEAVELEAVELEAVRPAVASGVALHVKEAVASARNA